MYNNARLSASLKINEQGRTSEMVTLNDVAKHAGVSISTASYVINRTKLHKVGAATQARIISAAKELNYRPSIAGRALAQGKTFIIGAVFPAISQSFIPDILQGLEEVLNKDSYSLLLCVYSSDEEMREKCQVLLNKKVDGMIIFPATNNPFTELLIQVNKEMPVVCLAKMSGSNEIPFVCVDGSMVNYLAVNYLLECGHRRIGIQCGNDKNRMFGTETALAGKTGVKLMVLHNEKTTGREILEWGLSQPEPPTAYLVYSDMLASDLMAAAWDMGVKVPDEISIIGVDGEDYGKRLRPQLTTVGQPRYEQGYEAGKLLLQRIGGEEAGNIILRPDLIKRASVKTLTT